MLALVEAIFESKTWFWISVLGKGKTPQHPVKLDKIISKGVSPIENIGSSRPSLVKIVLKVELGHVTSYVNVYAAP